MPGDNDRNDQSEMQMTTTFVDITRDFSQINRPQKDQIRFIRCSVCNKEINELDEILISGRQEKILKTNYIHESCMPNYRLDNENGRNNLIKMTVFQIVRGQKGDV